MGGCTSSPFAQAVSQRISNFDSQDVQAVEKVLVDAWNVYEQLSSKDKVKVKGLTKLYMAS